MTQTGTYHGGLVFPGSGDSTMDRFCRIVCATLEDYGHVVEQQTTKSEQLGQITSAQYHVTLTLETIEHPGERSRRLDAAAGLNQCSGPGPIGTRNRLVIELTPAEGEFDDSDMSELLIVVMLYRMVDICSAEAIEWLDPETRLTTEQFLSTFANVSPRRIRGRQQVFQSGEGRFAPVDDMTAGLGNRYDRINGQTPHLGQSGLVKLTDEEVLALAFRSPPHPDELNSALRAESDIRRLSSWSLTACLVFISAPVALSMAAVNLIRGEDFRLNTQVLSLTSAIVVLQSTGALADMLSYLQI